MTLAMTGDDIDIRVFVSFAGPMEHRAIPDA
jgi:hypothetical protein